MENLWTTNEIVSLFFLALKSIAFRSVKRITLLISISWHFIHYKSNEIVGFINIFFSLSFCKCRATRVHTLTKRKRKFAIWHFIKMKKKKRIYGLLHEIWFSSMKLYLEHIFTHSFTYFKIRVCFVELMGIMFTQVRARTQMTATQNFLRYTIRTDVLFIYNTFFLSLFFSIGLRYIFIVKITFVVSKKVNPNSIESLLSKCKCQQQERKKNIMWMDFECFVCTVLRCNSGLIFRK